LTTTLAVTKPRGHYFTIVTQQPGVDKIQFRRKEEEASGLRMRKKLRTRASIEEAAYVLFGEHGYDATTVEQIAERADVSTTTFFRYFPSKTDLVLSGSDEHLLGLVDAILFRPEGEADLVMIREAILSAWVPEIDPAPTLAAARAARNSPQLRGIYENICRSWICAVSSALAKRRKLDDVDHRSLLAARVGLGIFCGAVEAWVASDGTADMATLIRQDFQAAFELCSQGRGSAAENQLQASRLT
jgi:AcrR family transcriptional regulator